ncbi:MAG TPA: M23 family metallopeptidase [Bacteroidia bacterium]|jgi:murein DD-endopeptidase MepM/ murein hydrolase activator NlpD|nr:M23 family metallopeptidase [Bacteroidia bacterium]
MKKLLFFFCAYFLLIFSKVSAESFSLTYAPYGLTDTVRKAVPDTVPYGIEEEELESDSLEFFPAGNLYSLWDTINIHSPKFNFKELNDNERELTLCNEQSCGYVHPFLGNVTSGFGPRKRKFHYGMDIDLETGDQVVAAFDGKVRIAKKSSSYGNVIVIRHANGLETYYAHLSKINVEIDQNVSAGQAIGLGGNTGRSRGSHLHFEIRYLGQPINPTQMISFEDRKLLCDTFCLSQKTFSYYDDVYKIAHNNAKRRVHVVKKGETLSSIAKKYGTTVKSLSQKNKLKSKSTLRPGQKIKT